MGNPLFRLKARLRRALEPWLNALALWRILRSGYGYKLSVRRHEPLDAAGREIPWITYPALEYLKQLDFSAKSVFEFGAGNSTIYWSRQAARVTSVESSRQWFERVRPRLGANCELHLVEDLQRYPRFITEQDGEFDVVVIDGMERRACAREAVKKLRRGGMILLDNSDWHSGAAAVLRGSGLIEVDMTGFGPIAGFTTTTSFFFHREFAFPQRHDRQPVHGTGSLPHRMDG